MKTRHLMSIGGSIGLTLVFVTLVMTLPVTAAMPVSSRSPGSARLSQALGSVGPVLNGTTTSSTLSCREGLAGWEPYLSTGIDIQALGGGPISIFSRHVLSLSQTRWSIFRCSSLNRIKTRTAIICRATLYFRRCPMLLVAWDRLIASAPGSLWLVGNEPDRGPDRPGGPSQDDTFPAMYARVYHDAYQFIKQRDPTAQVAVAGLVEVTPGRMQYWDIVWDTYATLYGTPMPVDVWNMHLYALPEITGIAGVALGTDPSLAIGFDFTHSGGASNVYTYGDHDNLSVFDSQVRRMRQWMKDHGQEDKPLLLSEFGILYDENVTDEFGHNFTLSRAATFLTKTFNYLATASDATIGMPSDGNRLVQQWVWFSVNNPLGHVSNLVTDTNPLTFTVVGQMYQSSVASRALAPNLVPRLLGGSAPVLTSGSTSVTATLPVQIVNNGNQLVTVPLSVTFYSDAAMTQVIGSVLIQDDVPGCARRRVTASVAWPNLGSGFHSYWVKVDSANVVAETNETDNVASGQVFVGTRRFYLPLVSQNYP